MDWYHLKENLYQIGGSLKSLQAVESLLWQGQIEPIQALLNNCRKTSTIIKYTYYQAEQLCSIGSGSVDYAIQQIGARIKISGPQWNVESVYQILSLPCTYLNSLLPI